MDVILGGETVTVSIGHLWPRDWIDLNRRHPARAEADRSYGYGRAAFARAYLPERLKLNVEPPDADTWQAVWDLPRGEDPTNVEAVMWWHHIGEPEELMRKHRAERDATHNTPEQEGVTPQGDDAD